ncbi:MAG: FkbM family methyltransferase [Rhodospirillales bacterium]|nr:FkbM family methyltransferase [Rhodospirillales bacterium]MCB9996388.1 FkbM family methyltransferase [Rhodospirillales bacterium]
MTLAHKTGQLLPAGLRAYLQPKYHWVREYFRLKKAGGRACFDKELSSWVAERPFAGRKNGMPVIVRSYKEFRRIVQFGGNKADIVHKWIHAIDDCDVFYDIGAANGLEGFLCRYLHGSKVCFVEPFTASIETIMRNVYFLAKRGSDPKDFEVVHAGCDTDSHFDRAYMLCVPKAGETQISFSDPDAYERRGRTFSPVVTQWIAGVSIDDLHYKYGIAAPTHIKIDVDGYEDKVIVGAKRTISSGIVKSWAIEITGEKNMTAIISAMKEGGYVEIDRWEHYPGLEARTFDVIFTKAEDADSLKKKIGEAAL